MDSGIKKFLVFFAFLACSLPVFSCDPSDNQDKSWYENVNFYVGGDLQARRTRFGKGFGDNFLHRTHPQGNIYLGVKVSENFAVEGGYESTMSRVCYSTLGSGECVAGANVPSLLAPMTYKSKLKIKGPHVDFLGVYHLEKLPVELLLSAGISEVSGFVERQVIHYAGSTNSLPAKIMKKRGACLRLMTGAQYMTDYGLGIRGSVSLVGTHKMNIKGDSSVSSKYIPSIKTRDSIVYSLGAIYMF